MRNLVILFCLFAMPAFAGSPSPEGAVTYLYKAAAKSNVKKANKVLVGTAKETYGNLKALSVLNSEHLTAEKLKMKATLIDRDHHESLYLVQALKKSNKELVREFKTVCEQYQTWECTGNPFNHETCFVMPRLDCLVSE